MISVMSVVCVYTLKQVCFVSLIINNLRLRGYRGKHYVTKRGHALDCFSFSVFYNMS